MLALRRTLAVAPLLLLAAGCTATPTTSLDDDVMVDVEDDTIAPRQISPFCETSNAHVSVPWSDDLSVIFEGTAPRFARCLEYIVEATQMTGHSVTFTVEDSIPAGAIVLPSHCSQSGGEWDAYGFIPGHWEGMTYVPAKWHLIHKKTHYGYWYNGQCDVHAPYIPGGLPMSVLSPYTKIRIYSRFWYVDANYQKHNAPGRTWLAFW